MLSSQTLLAKKFFLEELQKKFHEATHETKGKDEYMHYVLYWIGLVLSYEMCICKCIAQDVKGVYSLFA